VLQLQCNSGQDSLSLARLGATVTGVDISDTAIEFARKLATEAGVSVTFERADLYDWLAWAAERAKRYDIVFSSYGAILWLSDLSRWATGIAAVLEPGGRLVVVDFHPAWMMLDDDWTFRYPYSGFGEHHVIEFPEGVGDYVAFELRQRVPDGPVPGIQDFQNSYPAYEFSWGIGDIVMALLGAGLGLEALCEYPASPYALRPGMRLVGDRWYPPEPVPPIALLFGIRAVRPGGAL
jgi:SAM-dependent methyltransferase